MSKTTLRSTPESAPRAGRRRRRWLMPVAVVVVAGATVALAAFQPWKLFIDKRVDEAAPITIGAAPTTVAPAQVTPTTVAAAVPTAVPATAPAATPTTVAPGPATPTTVAPTAAPATAAPATAAPAPAAEPAPTELTSGEHKTTGTVRLITAESGQKVLRFENLDTSNGPDVHVYLSPGADGYEDGAINIATLKGNKGNQNYEIPTNVDLSKFHSVVIWCKRFSVAFGQAPLPA